MKAQLLKCSDREKKMRKKVKGFQRQLRVQKTKVAQLANRKKDDLCQLASLKRDLVNLQAQHSTLISDQLELRGDGLGRPYIDDIEKCVMELCCELDVPTTKVGDVIGTVCRLVFHKVNFDSLPSASTANNMIDRAHVLGR